MSNAANATTILIVDDDDSIRQVLGRVLSRDGYRVLLAADAAEALRLAEAHRPDLALLDLSLPDGDGVELASALHARHPGLVLILMTAYPLRLRERPDLSHRFVSVLTKPVELPELRQALAAALRAAPPSPANAAMHPAPESAPEPVAKPAPASAGPWRGQPSASTLVVILALLALVVGGVFMLGVRMPWQKDEAEPTQPAEPTLNVQLVPGRPHTLQVPADVRASLGIRKNGQDVLAAARRPEARRPLVLPGSTMFDPTQVRRVRLRFAPAEVVRVGPVAPPGPSGTRAEPREFRAGDVVGPRDVLAEVFSPDVGSKKNDLFQSIVNQRLDEVILSMAEKASASLPAVSLWTYRRNVEVDRSEALRAEYTLKTWDIPQEDIDAVKKEARDVPLVEGRRPKEDDRETAERIKRWARVVIRSPFRPLDGQHENGADDERYQAVVVERNVNERELVVDNTQNLFVLARVDRLSVVANAPEDLLPELNKLEGRWRRWTIDVLGAPVGQTLEAPFDDISYLVDQNQHSLVIKGRINNPGKLLRGGLYVTATVQLPTPADVVEVPVSAVVDDGKQSVVFVQEDRDKPDQFTLRRVQVTHRFDRTVYVRKKPFDPKEARTPEEEAEGLPPRQPLTEGERVLASGVLELKKELQDQEANAAAESR
jgi:cobalt-zinc-cadmium efflux system membrane fusion protein